MTPIRLTLPVGAFDGLRLPGVTREAEREMVVCIPHAASLCERGDVVRALRPHREALLGTAAMGGVQGAVLTHATDRETTQSGFTVEGPLVGIPSLLCGASNGVHLVGAYAGMRGAASSLDEHATAGLSAVLHLDESIVRSQG